MSISRPLSALELTVLGVIYKRAPCLAHAVVVEFADSTTFAYRSGAGSIYPLLKRLTDAGILSCKRKKYALTEAGLEALRDWLKPPFAENEIATSLDTLRSRAYFLKLLSPAELAEFCDVSELELGRLLDRCRNTERAYQDSGDKFSEAAMRGAVLETEARIAWIRGLRETLVTPT